MRRRLVLIAGAVFTVLVGGMAGGYHAEEPFLPHLLGLCPPDVKWWKCENPPLLSVGFGLVCGLAFMVFIAVVLWVIPVRRVLTCRGCSREGWILDLEPGGVCPRCHATRFDARIAVSGIVAGGTMPFVEIRRLEDVSGAELLAKRRAGADGFI